MISWEKLKAAIMESEPQSENSTLSMAKSMLGIDTKNAAVNSAISEKIGLMIMNLHVNWLLSQKVITRIDNMTPTEIVTEFLTFIDKPL